MATGAQLITEALVELGVSQVFGLPGAQTLELFDEFAAQHIEAVPTSCERGAAFIGCGYAGVTGRPAVLAIVPGAGLTHALSGIAEAYVDGHPMLVLVTAIRNDLEFKYQLHEMDQAAVVRPVCKQVFSAAQVGQLKAMVHEAYQLAVRPPAGPTVIEVPTNLFWQKSKSPAEVVQPPTFPSPTDAELDHAAAVLRESERLAIYVGAGCFGAADTLVELAEGLQAPVATTLSGRGVIPEDHRLAAGYGTGPGGEPAAAKLLVRADTLLVVGARFAEVGTASFGLPKKLRVVHLDADPEVIGANIPTEVGLVGDATTVLPQLASRLADFVPSGNPVLSEQLGRLKATPYGPVNGERIHPGYLFAELRRHLPRDAVIVTDSGSHTFWAAAAFPVLSPRTYIAPTDYSSMGFGCPAAIGAVWAVGDRPVIATLGDGGFRMSAMELVEAMGRQRSPKVIVFNDATYSMIAHGQRSVYKRTVATDIHNPDFECLAAAFRMPFARLSSDAEVGQRLGALIGTDGPLFIEALVEPQAVPPYFEGVVKTNTQRMPLGEKLHFGARMLKRALFGVPQ